LKFVAFAARIRVEVFSGNSYVGLPGFFVTCSFGGHYFSPLVELYNDREKPATGLVAVLCPAEGKNKKCSCSAVRGWTIVFSGSILEIS
jgi:hypothetical protein